jgi:hypothetical protein
VDVPLSPGSRPCRLAAISHRPPTILIAVSRLSRNQGQSHIATDGQSISLGVEPYLGFMTKYLCLTVTVFFFVGRPLWREDGSVFCISYWPLSAQSFSGSSHLRLATIFYCLRFETSLLVASYDSQGRGGSIRPRRYTGVSRNEGRCAICSLGTDRTENIATQQLLPCCVLHSRYLAMAISLAPQSLLWATMPQYILQKAFFAVLYFCIHSAE